MGNQSSNSGDTSGFVESESNANFFVGMFHKERLLIDNCSKKGVTISFCLITMRIKFPKIIVQEITSRVNCSVYHRIVLLLS